MYEETIDLSHLKPEGLRIERRIKETAWEIQEADWQSRGELLFDLFLRGNPGKVEVQGSFECGIVANCHRCLKPFKHQLSRNFHLVYLAPDPERFSKEEVELTKEELEVSYLQNQFLPVHEMIQEQIYLSIPMKFLCKLDCIGLCVHCGVDLNEVECECPKEQIDARWAQLKAFKPK